MTYPDKAKIRAEIEALVLEGKINIPKNYILDSKEYVDKLAKDEFKEQRKLWDELQETERNKFPPKRRKVHSLFRNCRN